MIGTGLVWDTVYERLQEYGVTVLGARVTGVSGFSDSFTRYVLNACMGQIGVGGFVLGGGLSPEVSRCPAH